MPPMTGRVIAGRYNLVETIGRGAMGVVWRARDSLLDRDVAIKEVVLNGAIGDDERENAYRRTMREARTAARLSHRGVVTVYDVAEEDGRPWIIMELVQSRSLDQVLTSDGPLPPRRACLIGRQLLAALAAAHAAGVLHRDVKPSNVLIADDPDGERAVLTDFGIAQFAGDPRLTQTGMVMGSPGFTAPERIRGGIATPASDLWSLGATLYAAVQGRGPYEERGGAITTMSAIINEDAPPASSAGPLSPLIAALLRRNPVARPTAASAARMFAGVLPLLPEVPRPARRTPTLASATVPSSAPAGATSQDAVRDPGEESDGAAPAAAEKDAPPASTAEDATPAADEQAASEQAADDELAGDHIARDQADADDAAAAENDGADEDTGAENDSADDETSVDQLAGAEPGEAEPDETESDDAEPVGTEAADTEAAGDEAAGDGAIAEAERVVAAAAANGSAAEEHGPTADEAADAGEAQPIGEPGGAGKAEAADEAEPVRHAAAASEAMPRQAAPMSGAGMETPLLAPSWSWPETDGAGDAAWSVRDNWDPPTKPELSFGPSPLPRPRPRRWRRVALAAAAVVLAAAIGTAVALLTRHTPAASGSTDGGSTATVSSQPDPVQAINDSAAALPAGWTTETVQSGAHGTAGGFSIGVPSGWIERQSGLATYLDAPGHLHYMQVDLTRHDLGSMLAEAKYVERNAVAQGHLPGYHRVSLRPVTIRGTTGAYWSFTWVTNGGVTMHVDDLLFALNTSAGPQSYAVYLTSPAAQFGGTGGLPLFDRMLRTFAPMTG
ncbi:MAG TPA: protein kinase [Trebonia sp.]